MRRQGASTSTAAFDIVVVGAGLAGLQCTRLLARQGLSVLLVDRKVDLASAVHTTGIFVRRTLVDFEFPPGTLGPPVRHVTLYSPARRPLPLESQLDEFRVGRMGRLYQHLLADCEAAGARWWPDTRYVAASSGADGTVVELETAGATRRVSCRYLVGADGANSRVARDLGLDENREWIVGVEEVLGGVPLSGPPRFECYLDPKLAPGYIAWLVHDGEEVHVGVGGDPRRFEPFKALEVFKASLDAKFALSHARLLEKRGGRIPVGGVLRRIVNERGLLIGDAAGAVSPLTAGGLDACLRMSRLGAKVITEYLRSGNPAVLDSFAGTRFRTRFISRIWMRRIVSAVRHPAVLEMICALLRTALFKPLAWHVFFGRGSFPDLDLLPAVPLPEMESR